MAAYDIIGIDTRCPLPGEKYKHFLGKVVNVICVSRDSEERQNYVVYKESNDTIWHREIKNFNHILSYNGKVVNRFERVLPTQ